MMSAILLLNMEEITIVDERSYWFICESIVEPKIVYSRTIYTECMMVISDNGDTLVRSLRLFIK